MNDTPGQIDYQEIRDFLPREAQRYLDYIEDEWYRTWALNKFTRLLYTNEEYRCHYNQLRKLGYTRKQAMRMRNLAPARLHRILNQEIVVIFAKDDDGNQTDRYLCTINNSDNNQLNNFHNIDKGYIKANCGQLSTTPPAQPHYVTEGIEGPGQSAAPQHESRELVLAPAGGLT